MLINDSSCWSRANKRSKAKEEIMRIPHAPKAGRRIASPGPQAHRHVHAPHIDWGHVAAGVAALVLAIVVMWFFYQP